MGHERAAGNAPESFRLLQCIRLAERSEVLTEAEREGVIQTQRQRGAGVRAGGSAAGIRALHVYRTIEQINASAAARVGGDLTSGHRSALTLPGGQRKLRGCRWECAWGLEKNGAAKQRTANGSMSDVLVEAHIFQVSFAHLSSIVPVQTGALERPKPSPGNA
jgi:hypothetical protein